MKKFRKVYVEITNICNMRCSFCPETKRAKATMSVQDFEYIANQIKPYTDYVYLHVKGEPLIHPCLKEILDICEKYNLKVNISTNGTLLKGKFELLQNIRQLNVSLHSFEEESYEKLENYLNNVMDVCDKLSKAGVIIRYKLWNAETDNKNGTIIQILEQRYNADIQNTSYNKDTKLSENIFLSVNIPFKWPDLSGNNQQEGRCYGLRRQIAILVDGTVVPCCVDNDAQIDLGNIFETSLGKILDSDNALKIKRGFENNKCIHPLCQKCEYRIRVT